jgi:hypothetical protein
MEGCKCNVMGIRVENISKDTSPHDMYKLFSYWGRIFSVRVLWSDDVVSAHVAISMSETDAAEAVKHWTGMRYRGRRLRVSKFWW